MAHATDTHPLEIAPPGELADMARSIVPLRDELHRLLNQKKATTDSIDNLRRAVRERTVALSASRPATPMDILALTSHALELSSLVALAYERGFPRDEIAIWLLFLQTALESLLGAAERNACTTAKGLGLLSQYEPVGLIFGFADSATPEKG